MNRDVKVSVLMLAYNQQQYVDEAIRSVVLQEADFDYELIMAMMAAAMPPPSVAASGSSAIPTA